MPVKDKVGKLGGVKGRCTASRKLSKKWMKEVATKGHSVKGNDEENGRRRSVGERANK